VSLAKKLSGGKRNSTSATRKRLSVKLLLRRSDERGKRKVISNRPTKVGNRERRNNERRRRRAVRREERLGARARFRQEEKTKSQIWETRTRQCYLEVKMQRRMMKRVEHERRVMPWHC
jgi:hypothetical protein